MTEPDDGLDDRLRADASTWNASRPGAPPLGDAVARARHNRRRVAPVWLAAAAVLVVVLAVAVPLTLRSQMSNSPAGITDYAPATAADPLGCPSVLGGTKQWVPAKPVGVSATDAMVPPAMPSSAVVCAYDDTGDVDALPPLTGTRVLTGNLGAIRDRLTSLPPDSASPIPRACTLIGAIHTVHYLVGLTYQNGAVWVSTETDPNACTPTTNGVFVSDTFIGAEVDAAYQRGSWTGSDTSTTSSPASPTSPTPAPGTTSTGPSDQIKGGCVTPDSQRDGSQTTLVPTGAVSVRICVVSADDRQSTSAAKPDVNEFAATFDALPTPSGQTVCRTPAATSYLVLFSYADAPDVLVHVSQVCTPGVTNGYLKASATPALLAQLLTLTGVR